MKYVEAVDALKTYAELRPDDPNPHDSMGEIYLHSGDFENSIKAYTVSLEKDPTFNASHAGLGHNYCFTKEFAKAREHYKQFLDMHKEGKYLYASVELHDAVIDNGVVIDASRMGCSITDNPRNDSARILSVEV